MREMLFKDLMSIKGRKKDILLREVFEKDGLISKIERRCLYFIKAVSEFKKESNLQELLRVQDSKDIAIRRRFLILKEHNDEAGEDKVICKMTGTFYAVVGRIVYTIVFLHSFKARFIKASLAK